MTISTHPLPVEPGDEPSDDALLDQVRGQDTEAFRLLYERHRLAVLNCARQYTTTGFDAEDLAEEAFARVLKLLRAGAGPQTAPRAYLCTVVRHMAADRGRRSWREETVDDVPEPRAHAEGQVDAMAATVERGYIQRAFETLPHRWRQVLWYGEVEGRKPAEIATLLGMSPRSVSALAYRAREGLRQAYLQAHLGASVPAGCRRTLERMPAYVRAALPTRSEEQVREHLEDCAFCQSRFLELNELDRDLRGILAPLLLVGTTATGTAGVSGVPGFGIVRRMLGRLRDVVGNHGVAVVAGGLTASVVAAGAVVGLVSAQDSQTDKHPALVAPAAAAPAAPKAAAPAKPPARPKKPAQPKKKAPVPVAKAPRSNHRAAPAKPSAPRRSAKPAALPVADAPRPGRAHAAPKVRRAASTPHRVKPRHVPHKARKSHRVRPAKRKPPHRATWPKAPPVVKPPVVKPPVVKPPVVKPPVVKPPVVKPPVKPPVIKPHRPHRPGFCIGAGGVRACIKRDGNGHIRGSINHTPRHHWRHHARGRR